MNYRTTYASNGYRPTPGYRIGAYGDGTGTTPAPPTQGSLSFWFDAQDIDATGTANGAIADASQVATWKNKGTVGSAGDATQATGALRPLFRKVAAVGKLNGLSAVEGDGTQWLRSTASGSLAQPTLAVLVFRQNNLAALYIQYDAASTSSLLATTQTTGLLEMNCGSLAASNQAIVAATWETALMSLNGASTFIRLNGTQSATFNPGANGMNGVTLFADRLNSAGAMLPGMIAEFLYYSGTLPAVTDVEAYITAKYGATPQ